MQEIETYQLAMHDASGGSFKLDEALANAGARMAVFLAEHKIRPEQIVQLDTSWNWYLEEDEDGYKQRYYRAVKSLVYKEVK